MIDRQQNTADAHHCTIQNHVTDLLASQLAAEAFAELCYSEG